MPSVTWPLNCIAVTTVRQDGTYLVVIFRGICYPENISFVSAIKNTAATTTTTTITTTITVVQ
jgi:hypothetical protein